MTMLRSRSLLALLLLAGCAPSARERYGGARYAPSFHGYVVGSGPDAVVLRDPLTNTKVRCRERLEEVAPALAEALEDRLRDRHRTTVSRVALLPVSATGYVLTHTGLGLFGLAMAPGIALGSPSRRALYEEAGKAFVARRYREAADLYEQAIVRHNDGTALGDTPLLRDMILYYLAASREQSGDGAAARAAYQAFLDHGGWENEAAYRDAESALSRLGAPVPPCRSQEPLEMPWKEAAR